MTQTTETGKVNGLLRLLLATGAAGLDEAAERRRVEQGTILYEPGDDVDTTYFPEAGTIVSHVVNLESGAMVQVATVGAEGAIGGVVSNGHRPAFTHTVVLTGGPVSRVATDALDRARAENSRVNDLLCRYADAMLSQILQSVACNAIHSVEERFCRWLLTLHDRTGGSLDLTQEALAEMLGVQRTTLSRTAQILQDAGAVALGRGKIRILDRAQLGFRSCECYEAVFGHYQRILLAEARH